MKFPFFHRALRLDPSRPFAPYFLRSVVNASLDAIRKEWRGVPFDENCEEIPISTLLSQARSVESLVEFAQLKREIMQALAHLSPRQRAVIIQRYYLGMSEQEMAQELEIAHCRGFYPRPHRYDGTDYRQTPRGPPPHSPVASR